MWSAWASFSGYSEHRDLTETKDSGPVALGWVRGHVYELSADGHGADLWRLVW